MFRIDCRGAQVEGGRVPGVIIGIQTGNDGGLEEGSSHGGGRQWLDSLPISAVCQEITKIKVNFFKKSQR